MFEPEKNYPWLARVQDVQIRDYRNKRFRNYGDVEMSFQVQDEATSAWGAMSANQNPGNFMSLQILLLTRNTVCSVSHCQISTQPWAFSHQTRLTLWPQPIRSLPSFLLSFLPSSFQGCTSGIWKFPGQGVNWSSSNVGSLTHWERLGIEPESSWILVGFITAEP